MDSIMRIKSKFSTILWMMLIIILFYTNAFSMSKNCIKGPSYARFNNINIYYEQYGNGENAIVFIHGWSCDRTFWKYQLPVLKNQYHLIALDLPGYGLSDKPDNIEYSLDFFADAVNSVLEHARINKVLLIGHSLGFSIIRQFVLKYPEKCFGIVNVDGVYLFAPKDQNEYTAWQNGNIKIIQGFKNKNRKEYISNFINSFFCGATPPELRKEIKSKMLCCTPDYVTISTMDKLIDPEVWKSYPVINIPMLSIYAKAKDIPPDNEEKLRNVFPNVEYHEWEAGHFIMMEQPERFNMLLLKFVKKYYKK